MYWKAQSLNSVCICDPKYGNSKWNISRHVPQNVPYTWNVPKRFPPECISSPKTECSKLNKEQNPNAQMFQISLLRHILNGCWTFQNRIQGDGNWALPLTQRILGGPANLAVCGSRKQPPVSPCFWFIELNCRSWPIFSAAFKEKLSYQIPTPPKSDGRDWGGGSQTLGQGGGNRCSSWPNASVRPSLCPSCGSPYDCAAARVSDHHHVEVTSAPRLRLWK